MDSYSLEDVAKDAKTEAMIATRNQMYSIYSNNIEATPAKELILTGRVLTFAASAMGAMHNLGDKELSIDEYAQRKEQTGAEKQQQEVSLITTIGDLNKLIPAEVNSTESSEDESRSNSQDSTLKQLKRDIERDILCINGNAYLYINLFLCITTSCLLSSK